MTVTIPRWLLKVAAAGLAVVLVAGFTLAAKLPIYEHAPLGVWSSDWDAAGTASKMAFVRRMDALADRLPVEDGVLDTPTEFVMWAVEILPYMGYEGIIDGQARLPFDLLPAWSFNARAFHIAGQSACRAQDGSALEGPVWLNGRYFNPVSAWHGNPHALPVLVHELIHTQHGPFCTGDSEVLEANTQIATVEVLSAMVNHGNRAVLRPLLLELRSMGLAALAYDLDRADYMTFLRSISDDPFEIARSEKAYRYWQSAGLDTLHTVLRRYNVVPLNALIEGAHDGTVERITVPIWNHEAKVAEYAPFLVNDFAYFLQHADALVAAEEE